ncbi:MAG TPA: hypothetical protein VFE91_03930 [Nitrososphaerales archaeon]|nr:hypothetical protein [Nitrososphaerales archaeon]
MATGGQVSLQKEKVSCKECHGALLFAEESGEQVCSVCGVVTNDPSISMVYSRNYRNGLTNSDQREYPTSNMLYDLDLPTIIDSKNFDAKGVGIKRSYELTQLRRWNTYTISGDSRRANQAKALREIEQIVRTLGMSNSITRQACEVYSGGLKRGIIGGKSITCMAAASVLVASDMVGTSCSADDIDYVRGTVDSKTIRRYHKLLLKSMNLRVNTIDPSHYISKIAGRAKLNGRTERRALEILAQVKDNAILAGKRPVSLAAGALYLASLQTDDQTNQSRLAYAAGVTPMTIRERSSEISGLLT